MNNPKFEIFTGKDKQFYFRLKARNGENILASEGYTTKAGCKKGIESVKRNAADEARFERSTTKGGKFTFNLVALNGETIGRSESYTSESGRDNGIKAVMRNAPEAPVDDSGV